MDIFVINSDEVAQNIPDIILKEYQKKEITDHNKWVSHCLSYMMLDKILLDAYDIEDREIVFENNKPLLKSGDLYFSISHTDGKIVICFSDCDCGVDVEKMRLREFEKIAQRMEFECETLQDFYYEWTKFEAEYKLGVISNSFCTYDLDGYIITAVSENSEEEFELYMQGDDEDCEDDSSEE